MPAASPPARSPAPSGVRAFVRHVPREAWIWALALAALACTDPMAPPLVRLCPLDALGATWCPGCGLGHAVAHLLRGHLAASWAAHPLGLPAAALLAGRIATGLREAARHAARERAAFERAARERHAAREREAAPSAA